jgi:stage IV sporulation protein B
MNFKRKLLLFLISFCIIIPVNAYAYSKYLIPGGESIGINIASDGVFVVGFYKVDNKKIAEEAGFKIGDRIISVNDYEVSDVSSLLDKINSTEESINVKFGVLRGNDLKNITMKLQKDATGGYKTGIYVKDSITGIGTITYIDPTDNSYGALGHEVLESNSGVNFKLLNGKIFSSKITSINKARLGEPGEKNAKLDTKNVYGNINLNLETGIFGNLNTKISNESVLPVMNLDDVKIGKAEIITVLEGNKKEQFDIEILSIDKKNATKNFLIKITDDRLLKKTGGIIKGMSGSPIIQEGKIVGAITHTIVDNPTKGYGISIIKMLESIE